MSFDNPTFSDIGEQNIRERNLRARCAAYGYRLVKQDEDECPFQLFYVNERER